MNNYLRHEVHLMVNMVLYSSTSAT